MQVNTNLRKWSPKGDKVFIDDNQRKYIHKKKGLLRVQTLKQSARRRLVMRKHNEPYDLNYRKLAHMMLCMDAVK